MPPALFFHVAHAVNRAPSPVGSGHETRPTLTILPVLLSLVARTTKYNLKKNFDSGGLNENNYLFFNQREQFFTLRLRRSARRLRLISFLKIILKDPDENFYSGDRLKVTRHR